MISPARILPVFAFVLAAFFASAASAQTLEEQVETLLFEGSLQYEDLLVDEAEVTLRMATELIESSGMSAPPAADVYLMLGVVLAAMEGDAWVAYESFVMGLLLDPTVTINPLYSRPSLDEVFQAAHRDAVPEETGPTVAPIAVSGVEGMTHIRVREVQANRAIQLQTTITSGGDVARVDAYYRSFGENLYQTTPMRRMDDGVTWIGEVPASASRGVLSVDYYIEATDRAGEVIGYAGSNYEPMVVYVSSSDGPSRSVRSRRPMGTGEHFHLTLGVGSGIGLATSEPNVYGRDVEMNSGFALTPLHLGFEVAYAPRRNALQIVPFFRAQLVFLDSGVELEPMGGLKVRYVFGHDEPFRFYAQGGVGYGYVSHFVYLSEIDGGVYDTTLEGPWHVGGGGGLTYMFSKHVGVQADLYLMAMFADFSIHLDGLIGVVFSF